MTLKQRIQWDVMLAVCAGMIIAGLAIGLAVQHLVAPTLLSVKDTIPLFEPVIFWIGFSTGGMVMAVFFFAVMEWRPPLLKRSPEEHT